ncbi:hypothetical protein [Streptomyces sp. NPDC012450]
MSLTPSSVLGARKVQPIEGQLDLFGAEDEPDTTTEEQGITDRRETDQ